MKFLVASSACVALLAQCTHAFIPSSTHTRNPCKTPILHAVIDKETVTTEEATINVELERRRQKEALLGLIGGRGSSANYSSNSSPSLSCDPILADPLTKEPLSVSLTGPILGGGISSTGARLLLRSSLDSTRVFGGRTDAYINLLEPVDQASKEGSLDNADESKTKVASSPILSSLFTLAPPGLRRALANVNSGIGVEYIPMRDLFTSPSVSFAYERGWRQGFAAGGFPGVDKEFEMAREYFAPVVEKRIGTGKGSVVVDMSCATGLFTRRFAKSNEYSRVIGCDYSDSMLAEARRRIRADPELTPSLRYNSKSSISTRLDLVRCDVANIPLQTESIDALHAGAAMHCWPEMEPSLKEIHRVLIPGGRYFATTFLGSYFQTVAAVEEASGGVEPNMQAFQYFPTVDYLRDLLVDAGFESEKVSVEQVGRSCAIIRCEK